MLLGETRQFEIPAEEAYGAKGHSDFRIPPHAALVYEIKVRFACVAWVMHL